MDKQVLKELLKELFKSGEVCIELNEETGAYGGDYSHVTVIVKIDDEVIAENGGVAIKTVF